MLSKLVSRIKLIVLIIMTSKIWSWSFRSKFLRLYGLQIGENSLIGDNYHLTDNVLNLSIGKNVWINSNFFAQCSAEVYIEDYVRMGPFVKLMTRFHPIEAHEIRRKPGNNIDIPKIIGRGSWIGVGVIILPGADIAPGCVIAAGAVVAKTTTPNGLYAGVPARRIKDLPVVTASNDDPALAGD